MNPDENMATKKKRRIEKQNRRKHPEISRDIILIWEELRQKNIAVERKHELCDKIMGLSKTVLEELIRQKSTSRVFESVIENGVDEHRWTIFEIIKKDLLDLCKGRYSYFAIINMLKYGTKEQRMSVYDLMIGHIVELLQHNYASKVVEAAYNEFANSKQRGLMIQEFYGKTFALFASGKVFKHLSEFTSNSNYDKSILNNLHKFILPILRKEQIDLTIIQHVLFEYVTVLSQAKKINNEETAKVYVDLLDEVLEIVHESLLKLCNTREGTKLAILLFFECSSKLRKKIVQSCKEKIVEIATNQDAHLLLLAIIDQTDDTKLLDKSIIKPVMENIETIVDNIHGRKIIQFLVSHRDNRILSKFVIGILSQGDGNCHSKKDASVRAKEIVEFCTKPMLKWLENKMSDCLKYTYLLNVANSILNNCIPSTEELKIVYNNILNTIVVHIDEPIVNTDNGLKRKARTETVVPKKKMKHFTGKYENDEAKEEKPEVEEEDRTLIEGHIVESLGGNILVKSLCKLEKEGKYEGFSALCLEKISIENFQSFVKCNRTAFFIVFLYEIGNKSVQDFFKTNLSSLKGTMAKSNLPGVKILNKLLFAIKYD